MLNKQLYFNDKLVYNRMIGDSPAIRQIFRMIKKAASYDIKVLINGPTGVGKELVAEAIHQNSDRFSEEFVAVNCAAIPDSLLESELFGHVKGSYTGADSNSEGYFQKADGGTIFLDEIGDLSLTAQTKLLRVIESNEIQKVGSNKAEKVNVRIIAATNKDLLQEVNKGNFREDLYYRLAVLDIYVPPLRERRSDIELLATHFLGKYGAGDYKIDQQAMRALKDHNWPGNIRELENSIQSAVVLSDDSVIGLDDLGPAFSPIIAGMAKNAQQEENSFPFENYTLAEIEQMTILSALKSSGFVQKAAAKKLGISPRKLNYKIAKYGITNDHWITNSPKRISINEADG